VAVTLREFSYKINLMVYVSICGSLCNFVEAILSAILASVIPGTQLFYCLGLCTFVHMFAIFNDPTLI